MGRLNYTNRKIDGIKLGQVVAKDLTKRIPPALGSKAALRDPVIEIDLRSKQLTDAGFCELSEGLKKTLQNNGPQGEIVLLEELCLKANRLTVGTLEYLTPIIELVANDLRDLDLSDNLISVNDPDDVIPWEAFLKSLSNCCVLRRLDLSGNELGTKAFEVLARVYAREPAIDRTVFEELEYAGEDAGSSCSTALEKLGLCSKSSVDPDFGDIDGSEEPKARSKLKREKLSRHGPKPCEKDRDSLEKPHHFPIRSHQLRIYGTTRGIHSVPYIILSDTSMTDAGALYLSYIIINHHPLHCLLSLVPPAKAGPEEQQLEAYNETKCRGIVYLPNDKITKQGFKVLTLAEEERDRNSDGTSLSGSDDNLNIPSAAKEGGERNWGASPLGTNLKSRVHRRRTSGSANGYPGSSGVAPKSMSDLDRARSRIQGEELERTGQYGNDLWRIAMNMLCLCRVIQLPHPKEKTFREIPQSYQPKPKASLKEEFPALPSPYPPKPKKPIVKTLEIPDFTPTKGKAPTKVLPLGNGNPNQAIMPQHWSQKDSGQGTASLPSLPPTKQQPTSQDARKKISLARYGSNEYRSKLPCGFSEDIWWRILGHAAGAHGIMSKRQQKAVFTWAMNRNTLRRERERLGEKEGNQMWHTLDGMSCLAYEFDA